MDRDIGTSDDRVIGGSGDRVIGRLQRDCTPKFHHM